MYLLSILLSILSFTTPQTETFEVEPCEVKIEVSQGDFNKKEKIEVEVIETEKEDNKALYNIRDLEFNGILYNNGKKFTFYSQRVTYAPIV